MTVHKCFYDALNAVADQALAREIVSFTDAYRRGEIDAESRGDLIGHAIETLPARREQLRQSVIARRRREGHGVSDSWGLYPGEPDNAIDRIEVIWSLHTQAPDLAHIEVMGVA